MNVQLAKVNWQNLVIVASIILGGATAYNQIQKIEPIESKIAQFEMKHVGYDHKISQLEQSGKGFDDTLKTINATLMELNSTLSGLKATVEAMQHDKK